MSKLKTSIQENGGFQHWFVNVFWFHYKWPLLVAVAVVGIIAFITVDSLHRERYDTTVVIATEYSVDPEMLAALDDVLRPVVPDVDGNGRVRIDYAILYLGNTELGRENQQRMYLYMAQNDVALYLMSRGISDAYTDPTLEYFVDEVEQYGLEPDPGNPVRADLTGNKLLAECGMENIYLSILDFSTDDGSPEVARTRDIAVAMARAIAEAG